MNEFSLIDKIKILMDLTVSSPLFFVCSIFCIIILIGLMMCIFLNKRINKKLFFGIWIFIALIIIYRYNSIVFSVIDNLFDTFFMMLYFPNYIVYLLVLLISNICFAYFIFNKSSNKLTKIVSTFNAVILNILFFIIIDLISKNNINIYDSTSIYSNANLMALIQLSMGIFVSYVLILLLISASSKLKKYDEEVVIKPEILFDE